MKKIKLALTLIACSICFGYIYMYSFIPNDTYVGQQWPVKNTGNNIPGGFNGTPGCDMDVDSAWNITLGSDKVLIGLVDSGADTLHEDLLGNLVPGYNFRNGNYNVFDTYGHGTPTAGIIGAIGNNNKGISGISPICKIMPIKLYNSGNDAGVTDQMVLDAMSYSWTQGQAISVLEFAWVFGSDSKQKVEVNNFGDLPHIIADNSFDSEEQEQADQIILDGVTYGRNGKGTVWITGTGNHNLNYLYYPASNPNVISVGGIDPCNKRKAPGSTCGGHSWGPNYGPGLDVVAPCVKIYATDITGAPGQSSGNYTDNFWGTSAAMPNVAGVAALMLAVDSTLRWDSVRAIICRTAEKVGGYNYNQLGPLLNLGYTWHPEMGYGKINAYYALKEVVAGLNKLQIEVIQQGFYSGGKLNMKDTINVYLRSTTAPFAVVDSAKSFIDSNNFRSNLTFINEKPVSYYIVVKHRNSIETWSQIHSDNSFYSFISEQSQAYGDNLVEVDDAPLYGIYSGDINQDGSIDLNDVNMVYNDAANFVSGYVHTDVTGDRYVDFNDLLTVFSNANMYIVKQVP